MATLCCRSRVRLCALTIRRDKGDGAVGLEPRQPHALVELDVLRRWKHGDSDGGGMAL